MLERGGWLCMRCGACGDDDDGSKVMVNGDGGGI